MGSWRLCAVLLLSTAGCGPVISIPADTDDDTGTTDGGSTGQATRADSSGSGNGPSTANPVTTAPGTMTTPVPPETTVGPEPTSGSSGEPPGSCWRSSPLYDIPDDFGAMMRDHDNNGQTETWLFSSQGPETTTIVTADDGSVLGEFAVPGFLLDVVDIDGDGLGDIVLFDVQGGGPPQLGFIRAQRPFAFAGAVAPIELDPQAGFPAFLNVRDSAAADAFFTGDDIIQLLSGVGDGTYNPLAELPLDGVPVSAATPVRGANDHAVLAPFSFGDAPCGGGVARLFDSMPDFSLVAESGLDQPDVAEGPIITAVATPDGETVIYRKACANGGDGGLVVYRTQLGTTQMVRETTFIDADWSTAGDFDGDGDVDLLLSEKGAVLFIQGDSSGALLDTEDTLLPAFEILANQVLVADTDGDGRDEAILRVPSTPGSVVHARVELNPGCE